VVNNQQIAEMPLNGRNPIELVFLAGMANFPGNGKYQYCPQLSDGGCVRSGGQGRNGVGYLLDGALHQDPYNTWPFRCRSRMPCRSSRWRPAQCRLSTGIMRLRS